MPRFFIIDGNSLLFRSYYATAYPGPLMTTTYGLPTNAVFAFSNMIAKILCSVKKSEGIFVGFDADGETFRKAEFSSYKANRKPCPPELVKQFPASRELLDSLGIMHYEEHGIEADDICGTMAKKAAAEGYEVTVYTSDRDYLQLIDDRITVELLKTGLSQTIRVDKSNMKALFGYEPLQTIDYKALRGDSSDNLPGIPGIGEKTALKLIEEYGSFESILENAEKIKGKLGEKIKENAELGRECYRLATIVVDAKLPLTPDACLYKGYAPLSASRFAEKYELRNFVSRLPSAMGKEEGDRDFSYTVEKSLPGGFAGDTVSVYLDIEPGEYHRADPKGIAISDGKAAVYMDFASFLADNAAKSLLEKAKILCYDAKCLTYVFRKSGLKIGRIEGDLMIAAYLLDSGIKADEAAVYARFGASLNGREGGERACYCAYLLPTLLEKAKGELESCGAYGLYRETELPLASLLSEMESNGFPVDRSRVVSLGEEAKAKRDALSREIGKYLPGVNPNSPRQLQEALFGEKGLLPKRGKGTGVEVLLPLAGEHPVIPLLLEYRKYAKVLSTYVDGLLPYIDGDSKVRTYFNQAQTATGRLSSSSPNLQNISGRDEEGERLRKAFRYKDGRCLLSLDYSQIELRVLASLSHCKAYIEVFKEGRDIHSETARRIFPGREITHELRRKAKAVNFAIIYGTTVYGLSEQIGGSFEEAQALIDGFYGAYPEVKEYLGKIVKDATTKGYVTTVMGRRRYLGDINSPNYAKREGARRAALNAPVQGSAADILKVAMLDCRKLIREHGDKIDMVLTVHDEIIFGGKKEDLEEMRPLLEKAMDGAYPLEAPLKVEGRIAEDYYSCKE